VKAVPLEEAAAADRFGGKAAALARALAAGLPVPRGHAIDWESVNEIAGGAILNTFKIEGRCAVRSSAIGEDSADASFAGQHATILNVTTDEGLADAIRTIHASAHAEAAIEYRKRVGVEGEPRIAVVVQQLVDADVAGVLFTRDPITGADERVIEAAWGLGEAVVAGLVTPDRYRIARSGKVLAREPGVKEIAIRAAADGGTVEEQLDELTAKQLTLSDRQLAQLHALAAKCEEHFGAPQDIEFAFARGELFLLQSRPVTRIGSQTTSMTPRRFVGLGLAALLAPLNSTIIAVALPSIAGEFNASGASVTRWLVTAYLVVTIVAQSPAGKLADRFGYSLVLTLGRAMFGTGALLAAFSPSLPLLGAGRVLMAVGGALTIPTVLAELRNSVPQEKRGRVFGIFGAIMGTAAAAGPFLGGFLTARFGWHSIFFVNVPVVLLSFLLEPLHKQEQPARRARFDVLGSALLAVVVLLLVLAVERNSAVYTIATLAMLAVFIAHELRAGDPVLDVRLFARAPFAAGSSIVALQNLTMYALLFLLPFFLGDASRSGRMLLLFTASMVLCSPIGGRLSDAIGPRIVALTGALLATAGAWMFVTSDQLIPSLIILGAGIGVSTSPSQAAALGAIEPQQAGVASGALGVMRYVGGVIGSGLVALLAGTAATRSDPRLLVFPAVCVLSAIAALFLQARRR
jgi:EmrB/QacA subfamily drug resistance transporter